jgi:hypothetical protein
LFNATRQFLVANVFYNYNIIANGNCLFFQFSFSGGALHAWGKSLKKQLKKMLNVKHCKSPRFWSMGIMGNFNCLCVVWMLTCVP